MWSEVRVHLAVLSTYRARKELSNADRCRYRRDKVMPSCLPLQNLANFSSTAGYSNSFGFR